MNARIFTTDTTGFTHAEFTAFTIGMLSAAMICEERAGRRASHNAMAIMRAHRHSQLKREQARLEKNEADDA